MEENKTQTQKNYTEDIEQSPQENKKNIQKAKEQVFEKHTLLNSKQFSQKEKHVLKIVLDNDKQFSIQQAKAIVAQEFLKRA